jgi:molybdopterin-guanine dinucleotide biosynthesis protein A
MSATVGVDRVAAGPGVFTGAVDGYAAVVLAGGRARRLGGVRKPALDVGGRSLLARVLGAVVDADPRIVVGPRLDGTTPEPTWTRETPPGAGPVAALRAALPLLPPHVTAVAVLAADLPFLDHDTVVRLRSAVAAGADAAVLVDGGGRDQYLTAVWSTRALHGALSTYEGDRVGEVYAAADRVERVGVAGYPPGAEPWRDVDDPTALDRARASLNPSVTDPLSGGAV